MFFFVAAVEILGFNFPFFFRSWLGTFSLSNKGYEQSRHLRDTVYSASEFIVSQSLYMTSNLELLKIPIGVYCIRQL